MGKNQREYTRLTTPRGCDICEHIYDCRSIVNIRKEYSYNTYNPDLLKNDLPDLDLIDIFDNAFFPPVKIDVEQDVIQENEEYLSNYFFGCFPVLSQSSNEDEAMSIEDNPCNKLECIGVQNGRSSKVEELKIKITLPPEKLEQMRRRQDVRDKESSYSSSDDMARDSSSSLNNPQDEDSFGSEEPKLDILSKKQDDIISLENLPADNNDDNRLKIPLERTQASDSAVDVFGEIPSTVTEYGREIDSELANQLEYYATNGITQESRKELIDTYRVPSNCIRIGAPILNAEVKSALPENLVKWDESIETRQKVEAETKAGLNQCNVTKNNISNIKKVNKIMKGLSQLPKKKNTLEALARIYFRKKIENELLLHKKLKMEIRHNKQQHRLKMLILKKKADNLN